MFRSKYAHKYLRSASALVVGLVLAAAIWSAYTRQPAEVASDPQAGVAEASGDSRDLLSTQRTLDLGAGYRLELDEQGGWIVAPSAPLKEQPANAAAAGSQTLDLGPTYRMQVGPQGEQAISPSSSVQGQAENTTSRRIDLGAGYVLEMNGESGRIIPPETVMKADTASTSHSIDLGAGYTLELDDSGGQIVAPSTPVKELPATAPEPIVRIIPLGNGYTLVIGPNGGRLVPDDSR